MNEDANKQILEMIRKASEAHDTMDAMRLTQSALNAANTLAVLNEIRLKQPAK